LYDSFMILRTDNIIKKYRKRIVVRDVSIKVEQGEIVGLLGPNGAGKTTSFYIIVGYYFHASYRVHPKQEYSYQLFLDL